MTNLTPLVSIALTVLMGVAAIGWFAIRILSADDPSPVASPQIEPEVGSWASQTPVTLLPFGLADTSVVESSQSQTNRTSRSEAVSTLGGDVFTYRDNDTSVRVLLQSDLTVQQTSANTPADVVVMKGGKHTIVRKQAWHGPDAPPVFRSESGGELMMLPGGVLLALDATWTETEVEAFFVGVGIVSQKSELDFTPNSFLIETEPGFPSLELANRLADYDGVLISTPNWLREVDTR